MHAKCVRNEILYGLPVALASLVMFLFHYEILRINEDRHKFQQLLYNCSIIIKQ